MTNISMHVTMLLTFALCRCWNA